MTLITLMDPDFVDQRHGGAPLIAVFDEWEDHGTAAWFREREQMPAQLRMGALDR
jgi:hypothetical protein